MNCQNARRQILIDPQRPGADVDRHVKSCYECRLCLESARHNDELLRGAFAIEQPKGLQDRLIAEANFTRSRRRLIFGLAASVAAVSTGAAWLLRPAQATAQQWASAMVDHIHRDPQHLYSADPHAREHLQQALATIGGKQIALLPEVIRAGSCDLLGHRAAHVVFELRGERAVSFLVGHETGIKTASFNTEQWCGQLRGIPGGKVGVFASNEECMGDLGDALTAGVRMFDGHMRT